MSMSCCSSGVPRRSVAPRDLQFWCDFLTKDNPQVPLFAVCGREGRAKNCVSAESFFPCFVY